MLTQKSAPLHAKIYHGAGCSRRRGAFAWQRGPPKIKGPRFLLRVSSLSLSFSTSLSLSLGVLLLFSIFENIGRWIFPAIASLISRSPTPRKHQNHFPPTHSTSEFARHPPLAFSHLFPADRISTHADEKEDATTPRHVFLFSLVFFCVLVCVSRLSPA